MGHSKTNVASAGRSSRSRWLAPLVLAAAGIAAYSNSFDGDFLFDGDWFIATNPDIRTLEFPNGDMCGAHRPVGFYTFALNYWADGYRVWGWHAANLAIHIAAALTLLGIVRRTLESRRLGARYGASAAGLALVIALCWELHPLETQSVTYIYQRLESLMGLCFLLTLYCFIRSAGSPRPGWWRAASVAICALGMGVKEVIVVAPLVVLWYDRVFVADSWRAIAGRWKYYTCLFSTCVIAPYLVLWHADRYVEIVKTDIPIATPLRYALSQPGVICHYLRLCFVPTGLCLEYGWPVAEGWREIAPPLVFLLALMGVWVWCIFRRPAWGFLGAAFFLPLAPTSSINPVAALAFEHRMYLSLAAVVVATVIGIDAALRRWAVDVRLPGMPRRLAPALAASVALLLGSMTWIRNEDYHDTLVLWRSNVAVRPQNPTAWSALSHELKIRGDIDGCIAEGTRAIELEPRCSAGYINRGSGYLARADYAAALSDFDNAVKASPANALCYAKRAFARLKLKQYELAMDDCTRALEAEPPLAADQAAMVFTARGKSRQQLGDDPGAVEDCTRAIAISPEMASPYITRAKAYGRLQDFQRSADDCRRLHALDSSISEAWFLEGVAELNLCNPTAAVRSFGQAIELSPRVGDAYFKRAIAYLELGDAPAAYRDIESFRRLGGQPSSELLNRLDVALQKSTQADVQP